MGFLDNVRDALKDAISTRASKDAAAEAQGARDESDSAAADDPVDADTSDTETTEPADSATPAPTEAAAVTYTVKTGDTLAEIGARFGVSYLEIAKLNNIENPDLIFPGQVFRIMKD